MRGRCAACNAVFDPDLEQRPDLLRQVAKLPGLDPTVGRRTSDVFRRDDLEGHAALEDRAVVLLVDGVEHCVDELV